jgi:hypothetical protein
MPKTISPWNQQKTAKNLFEPVRTRKTGEPGNWKNWLILKKKTIFSPIFFFQNN